MSEKKSWRCNDARPMIKSIVSKWKSNRRFNFIGSDKSQTDVNDAGTFVTGAIKAATHSHSLGRIVTKSIAVKAVD